MTCVIIPREAGPPSILVVGQIQDLGSTRFRAQGSTILELQRAGKHLRNPQLLPIIVHAHPQLLSHQIYTHPGMPPPRTPPGTCTDSLTLRGKAATTSSQLPLPLIWSGGLTGQTIYNSEVWLKIVQFRFSLLGRRAGVARAKKWVETMTPRESLESASHPGQSLLERAGSFKGCL